MKSTFVRAFSLLVLALVATGLTARDARAQQASKGKLKVEIDSTFNAMLVIEGDETIKECRPDGSDTPVVSFQGTKPLASSRFQLGKRGAPSAESRFVTSLMRPGTKIQCNQALGGPFNVALGSSGVVSLPISADSPEPAFVPDLEWIGFDTAYGEALQARLGNPSKCAYLPDGVTQSKQPCAITPVNRVQGPRFTFQVSPAPTAGKISVTFERSPMKLLVPIVECKFKRTEPMSFIVPGASRQRVFVTSDEPGCNDRLSVGESEVVSLVADPLRLGGSAFLVKGGGVGVELGPIDATISASSRNFELRDASEHLIGNVTIPVTQAMTVDPVLDVHYADQGLEAAQPKKSKDGIAVLDPFFEDDHGTEIINIASLVFPPELASLASTSPSLFTTLNPPNFVRSSPLGVPMCTATEETLWTASTLTEDTSVQKSFEELPLALGALTGEGVILRSAARVAFRATRESSTPRKVRLKRWHVRREGYAAPGHLCGELGERLQEIVHVYGSPLIEFEAKVAVAVKRKSIPLPVRDLIQIRCQGGTFSGWDIATNGMLSSLGDGVINRGGCIAFVDYTKFAPTEAPDYQRAGDLLRLYGPQSIKITVHRDGATDTTTAWTFNEAPVDGGQMSIRAAYAARARSGPVDIKKPDTVKEDSTKAAPATPAATVAPTPLATHDATLPDSITLIAPKNDDKGSGVYLVNMTIAVKQDAATPYHDGVTSTLAEGDVPTHPLLNFEARLNSRGPFGWTHALRTFVTVPVEVVGLRFPARSADLHSTNQTTHVQLTTPRVGILIGLEPWDYDQGKNRTPMGLRILGGFHLLRLGDQQTVAVSTVVGGALTLPLVESPTQLGTSLALGCYWENDLRDPFKDANHVLITAGFNVLNLLGSK